MSKRGTRGPVCVPRVRMQDITERIDRNLGGSKEETVTVIKVIVNEEKRVQSEEVLRCRVTVED